MTARILRSVTRGPALAKPLVVHLPVETIVEANRRGRRSDFMHRQKALRTTAWATLRGALFPPPQLPVVVLLYRPSVQVVDDDNLPSALKFIRDGVADWLVVDDGDLSSVSWIYRGSRHPTDRPGVAVEVRARPAGEARLVTGCVDLLLRAGEVGAADSVVEHLRAALDALARA